MSYLRAWMLNRGGGGDGSGGGERVHFEWRQSACSEIFSFTLLKYFFFLFFFAGIIIITSTEDYAFCV